MVSISKVVSDLIEEKPFLEIGLSTGVINYSKLADELLPEVQNHPSLQGSEVKQSAVMMALRRIADNFEDNSTKLIKILANSASLEMDYSKYNLFSVTVERNQEVNSILKKLYDIVDIGHRDLLTITSGMTEVTIISNMRHKDQIIEQFPDDIIIEVDNDLASISLMIPQDSFQTPGLFYMVTKQLYWDGVNIRELVSTLTEMNFIVKQIDIPKAMESLQRLVSRN